MHIKSFRFLKKTKAKKKNFEIVSQVKKIKSSASNEGEENTNFCCTTISNSLNPQSHQHEKKKKQYQTNSFHQFFFIIFCLLFKKTSAAHILDSIDNWNISYDSPVRASQILLKINEFTNEPKTKHLNREQCGNYSKLQCYRDSPLIWSVHCEHKKKLERFFYKNIHTFLWHIHWLKRHYYEKHDVLKTKWVHTQ